jgi:peroxiredoxin
MALQLNVQAPDVTLTSNKGDTFKLSEQWAKGPVVLAFFPMAFTGVCTEEMCEIRDGLADFGQLKAQVFGISVDSRFALNAFAEKNNIGFPLLSDFNKEAIKGFGVAYENFLGMHGVAKRSVFVIDNKGHVAYSWVTEDAKQRPNFGEVRDALGKL